MKKAQRNTNRIVWAVLVAMLAVLMQANTAQAKRIYGRNRQLAQQNKQSSLSKSQTQARQQQQQAERQAKLQAENQRKQQQAAARQAQARAEQQRQQQQSAARQAADRARQQQREAERQAQARAQQQQAAERRAAEDARKRAAEAQRAAQAEARRQQERENRNTRLARENQQRVELQQRRIAQDQRAEQDTERRRSAYEDHVTAHRQGNRPSSQDRGRDHNSGRGGRDGFPERVRQSYGREQQVVRERYNNMREQTQQAYDGVEEAEHILAQKQAQRSDIFDQQARTDWSQYEDDQVKLVRKAQERERVNVNREVQLAQEQLHRAKVKRNESEERERRLLNNQNQRHEEITNRVAHATLGGHNDRHGHHFSHGRGHGNVTVVHRDVTIVTPPPVRRPSVVVVHRDNDRGWYDDDYEDGYDDGYDDGFDDGYDYGYDDGYDDWPSYRNSSGRAVYCEPGDDDYAHVRVIVSDHSGLRIDHGRHCRHCGKSVGWSRWLGRYWTCDCSCGWRHHWRRFADRWRECSRDGFFAGISFNFDF